MNPPKTISSFLLLTSFLILPLNLTENVHAWPVPDTGQTKCYGDAHKEIIPCPKPGERFYGQDGNYSINPMSYTKLNNGEMVKDNVTGLIWENKQDMDGTKNYANPHDADNT